MDDKLFRQAMGRFATGVTVITTEVGENIHGMTANAFMSISMDPKLVTISIDNKATMLEKINISGSYAVNILSEQQKDISMHFAGQTKEKKEIEFGRLMDVPVIKDSLASVVCDVDRTYEVGDHTLFIGKVREIEIKDGDPLLFYCGCYGTQEKVDYAR
nr:flavin reductase family protein [Aquibacillus sediminis]